jgi:nitrite reductase (NADH) small subunit
MMLDQNNLQTKAKRGAEDSGRYFKYMADFIGLDSADVGAIKRSKPIIEKHLPEIVAAFYSHLLRYPPTRKFFLKKDGSIDQDYVELRMRHLTNFWLRTADGIYDEEYARYVDYVGRAHTAHGADPGIYIAERYVIGQVGFIQHAIGEALTRELRNVDAEFEAAAIEAWDKLMMVILEMLSRAYGSEREAETFDALVTVDQSAVSHLAEHAFEHEHEKDKPVAHKDVVVARVDEIPEGERKVIQVGVTSIGVLHHNGQWIALRNSCLHRGGPVLTGCIEGDTITCPWHGFQYDVRTGELLVDPNAKLDSFPVTIKEGQVHIQIPENEAPPQTKI